MSKRRKQGRLKDHNWSFIKYKGDTAIYARCSCGFEYACCNASAEGGYHVTPAPEKLYPYCPYCGSKKKWYTDEVKKINKYPWT